MRERTELLIRGMTENRTKRHRWLAMVTALAFLTGGNVFWSLREIGTAVTEETLCTREAHQHSEECYDENGSLICGKEEHVHTAACFSDENADVETAEIWEATLPERAGLSHQEQVALIAESQLGYAESVNNFILGEDGVQHGYTRYGAWYGNPYGEWNTMFTYFCLYYAGVSTEEIPCIGNARTWQVKLTENELIRPPDTEPERGEVVLLDLDADGEADLTGIVTDTAEMLHFVEGNLGHAVAEGELALDAEQILGYVAIPEPDTPDAENPEASPPDESLPEDADESSPDAESAPTEEQPETTESKQPLVTYRAEAPSGIQVSAAAAEGVFPADTVMTVTDVPREEALQAAAEGLSAGAETLDAVAVDISFYAADGTELEPDGGVDVEITLPETQQLAGENYTLLHVADDGAVQTVEAEFADDAVTFTAERFSMYVVAADGIPVDKNNVIMLNGEAGNNSQTNPYVLCVGETIEVWYDSNDPTTCRFTVLGNDYDYDSTSGSYLTRRIDRDGFAWSETGFDKIEDNKRKARFKGITPSQASDNNELRIIVRDTTVNVNGDILESLWVKVVNPLYTVNGNTREKLQSTTLAYNVGDTFTLSLDGDHRDLFAVDSSGQLSMGTPYIKDDGNTYVDFVVCKKTGSESPTITVEGRPITVNITNNHLYRVEDNGSRTLIDGGTTIYANVGGKFKLSVNEGANHLLVPTTGNSVADYTMDGGYLLRGQTAYGNTNINGATVTTTTVEFTCLKPGVTSFIANGKQINVIIGDRSISVQTALGIKSIDTVHEFLALVHGGKRQEERVNVLDPADNTLKPKYIRNGPGDNAYRVSSGELITVFATIPKADYHAGVQFSAGDNRISLVSDSQKIVSDDGTNVTITAQFQAGSNTLSYGLGTEIRLGGSDNSIVDSFYIVINGDNSSDNIKTHADIEIDDDGNYVVEEYSFDPAGNLKKTITKYSAFVSAITYCKIYDAQGQPLKFLGSSAEDKSHEGQNVEFDSGDYIQHHETNQSSQYELTSNYVAEDKHNESSGEIMGYWLRGNKNYSLKDAQRADFKVDLTLTPKSQVIVTIDKDGNQTEEPGTVDPTQTKPVTGMEFSLNRQAILDAYNKCPVHSGLDFTLAANSLMVDFQIKKNFVGGDLKQKHFTFELLDLNDSEHPEGIHIEDKPTDDDGIVQFSSLFYDKPGSYKYKVHEKNVSGDTDILFAEDRVITITVAETTTGELVANMEDSILDPLTNYQTYRLPDTGGSGTLPWYLGGTAILAAASLLLIKKRREGS